MGVGNKFFAMKFLFSPTILIKMESRYQFDLDRHIHTLDGKPLMGVTTILSVIAKPALIQWAANMAVDYVEKNIIPEFQKDENWQFGKIPLVELLKEARTAHRKKKESAGDWGTEIHKEIEQFVKDEMKGRPDFQMSSYDERIAPFIDWVDKNKVTFLASEKNVWSEELWVGGIADMVIEMDGKKYVADIKTSSGIYNEHFFQMAAYDLCLEEMGGYKDIAGYIVINLKKNGKMEIKMVDDISTYRQGFINALGLHKIIQSLERKNYEKDKWS